MATQTGFIATLTARLAPGDLTMYISPALTVTAGRLLIVNGNITEWVKFTGTANGGLTVTGLTRNLSKTADPVTGGTGLDWGAGSQVIMVVMHDNLIDKEQAIPIVGYTTAQRDAINMSEDYFTGTFPIIYNTTLGQYQYYTGVAWAAFATGTVADATTSVKGSTTMSVAPVIAATPIAVGNNDIRVNPFWVSTGGVNTFVITPTTAITAYALGQIFSFRAVNANTGASTLNVNGLGAIAINKGAGATALSANDILANQIVTVQYNGTNFQMTSPVGNPPASTDVQTFTTSGTWTKPAGAKFVDVYAIGSGGGGGGGGGSVNGSGGGGAGAGGYSRKSFGGAALGSTETVTVGAGGSGGAGNATTGTGSNGSNGNASSFGTALLITATGGTAGAGGTGSSGSVGGAAGAGGTGHGDLSGTGGAGGAGGGSAGAAGVAGVNTAILSSPRGGAGGGAGNSGGTGGAGGAGGGFITNYVNAGGAGGAAGTVGTAGAGFAGTAGNAIAALLYFGGTGGGGGGGSSDVGAGPYSGGNGGAGGTHGAGGGGGGGKGNTGGTGGAGGVGGAGQITVITYF